MALFIKSVRARRLQRHQQFSPLGAKLAAAIQHTVGTAHTYTRSAVRPPAAPEDTARNRKLLAKKANYQGHERPGMAVRVSVTGCASGEGIFRGCGPNAKSKLAKESYDNETFVSVIRAY